MQLNQAANKLNGAQELLNAQKQKGENILANLGDKPNLTIDAHPIVQLDLALLEQAKLNLSYALIKAPIDGVVTKVEQLQVGDYVHAEAPVFALVSNQNIWVEANFKETQLTHMHVGQKAEIDIDAFPQIKFIGHVESISPGTGSTFSLLPPENATGNWVKIVQRVPVRISIENLSALTSQISSGQLSSGLSATVTVDTKQ